MPWTLQNSPVKPVLCHLAGSGLKALEASQHVIVLSYLEHVACHPGSRKRPPHQACCRRHPLQSQFCRRWAEPCHYTWGRHRSATNRLDTTAPLVDPQLALLTLNRVAAITITTNNTGLAEFPKDIMTMPFTVGVLRSTLCTTRSVPWLFLDVR